MFFGPGAESGTCGACLERRRPFRIAVAAGPWDGVFQRALVELKFRRRETLAPLLAAPCVEAFRRATGDPAREAAPPPVAATAVPLPFWRRARRGFNQAELLAEAIARELGIPLARGLLRKRARPPQTRVAPHARVRNVRGAFRARLPERLRGAPLLLVDDVITTGATVEAAVRALRKAGAGPVDVLTVAHTLPSVRVVKG